MSTKNSVKRANKTALPAEASSLIAHARNDITIPFYSGVLAHADDTLIARGGGKGLKIYDEIERDTMAGPVLQKRRKTLIARDWTLEPASDDARDIEAAQLNSVGPWMIDAGWAIAGGVAQHTAGTADAIAQGLSTTSGKFYRIGYAVSTRMAGTLQAVLSGGSDRPGAYANADGLTRDRIQAVTGNDTFELRASSDFDGAVDDVVAYLETSACLSAGTHYVWIEPQNADGVPGPVSGPYLVEII